MQSSSQIITTIKPTSSFFTGRMPFLSPTNSVKALKGKISHSMDLLTPSSPGGLPTLSLTTNSSWLPWGRVAMPLISPPMPVPLNVTFPLHTLSSQSVSNVFLVSHSCHLKRPSAARWPQWLLQKFLSMYSFINTI